MSLRRRSRTKPKKVSHRTFLKMTNQRVDIRLGLFVLFDRHIEPHGGEEIDLF